MTTKNKSISILGSTGSVGVNTLEVVEASPGRYQVKGLAGGRNVGLLAEQVRRFQPEVAAVMDRDLAIELEERLGPLTLGVRILHGKEGYREVATLQGVDMVVSAIVGAAGLVPTMAAIDAGKDVALANKETLVTAGPLVMEAALKRGVKILPVDSEHSAIFQCLAGQDRGGVRRLVLTASGGPFRTKAVEDLAHVTPEEAIDHPNWSMGRKISVDSATLMNKGLEVIEARWLFDVEPARIDVVVHPQSIIHSMVEFVDGSVLAQMGLPDMRVPIACALSWPERLAMDLPSLDFFSLPPLTFSPPDHSMFPCLDLAFKACEGGGTWPAVLNAANEVAVEAFLEGRIGFTAISRLIRRVMEAIDPEPLNSLDDVLRVDALARLKAHAMLDDFS